jgi:hypothetical protein
MADKGATQPVRPRGRGNPGSSVAVTPSAPQQSRLRKRTETLSSTFLGDHSRPSKRTIYLLLMGFAVFIILGSIATQFPTQEMRLVFTTISSALLLCLVAASSLDLATRSMSSDLMSRLISADMLWRTSEVSSQSRQYDADGAFVNDIDDSRIHAAMVHPTQPGGARTEDRRSRKYGSQKEV